MMILIIEDNLQDRELLMFTLQEHFKTKAKFREARDLKTAHDYLMRGGIDAIVLDLQLPDSSGFDTFARIHKAYPHIPIIIVTHNTNIDLATEIIRKGAEDVIIKDFVNTIVLFRRILFAIERNTRNRNKWMTSEPPPSDPLTDDDTQPNRKSISTTKEET